MSRYAERNREIVRRHLEDGEYFQHIAPDYGITRERVRQIVRAAGVTPEQSKAARLKGRIGNRLTTSNGYIKACYPGHPRADHTGYVLEHIIVAEKAINRRLRDNECVHHINGIRADNRPANLKVMTHREHARLHSKRWTEAALLDSMRWLALQLGHTPRMKDLNSTDGLCHMLFVGHFGSVSSAQEAAGLAPNSPGARPGLVNTAKRARQLTAMFRKRYAHLADYATLDALLDAFHDGLPSEHEASLESEAAA